MDNEAVTPTSDQQQAREPIWRRMLFVFGGAVAASFVFWLVDGESRVPNVIGAGLGSLLGALALAIWRYDGRQS